MIIDWIVRGWENFLDRTTGPMWFRFILQPLMAVILATRAGWRDARDGRPAFLWATLFHGSERKRLLLEALRDVRNVLILAVILDLNYQFWMLNTVYPLELILTAMLLAFVPYVLVRGPANRLFRLFRRENPT